MSTRSFNGTRRDRHSRFSQGGQHLSRIEAADAAILEEFGNRTLANTRRFVGARHEFPKIKEPFGTHVVFELEHRREVAPELLAHAISEAVSLPS